MFFDDKVLMSRDCIPLRSMVQPGRFVLPMDEKDFSETWAVFKHTPLMKNGSVVDLPIPSADEISIIEDVGASAVPSFTGQNYVAPRGERVCQLGEEAASKVLRAAMTNIGGPTASKPVVLVVDATTHTGDFMKGFARELFGPTGKSVHMYYSGFCESENEVSCCKNMKFSFSPPACGKCLFPMAI